jgi:sec-independent protein translocase protein TatC
MSILQHLDELRSRLIKAVLSMVGGFLVAYGFSEQIYDFVVAPAREALPEGTRLAYTGIADPFLLYLKVSLLAGLFISAPFVLSQLWLFVSPGLYRKEKRWAFPFVTATTFFFVLGGAFAYKSILPFACNYFISVGNEAGFMPVITVKEILSFEVQLILGTAVLFELPVLIFFLTRIGVVTPAFLFHFFPHTMVVLWLLSAWLTPPDIVSMILVGLPMTGLYLFSIGVSWLFMPGRKGAKAPAAGNSAAPRDRGDGEAAPPPDEPDGSGSAR